MLKVLRHKGTQKNIYMFLAVAVVVSFVVSGVLISRDDKSTTGALAMLDKHPITVQQYLDSYRAVERQASFMYGDKLNEVRSRINFKGEAWDRLLLLNYARKQNIHASDEEVVEWISKQEAFQNKGKFDDKLYALYIERALRSTPRAFEEEIRQMLTLTKVQESIKSASSPADDKLKELYQAEKTEKDLLYAILPWENLKDKVTVTDKEIDQLYTVVKDKLTAPEQVKVSVLFIPQEKSAELKTLLEDKTQKIDQLSKSAAVVLKETGYFSKNDAVPELGNAPEALSESFRLAVGGESAWIKTDKGSYKIKLLDKKPEHTMSLEESKGELKNLSTKQTATELAVKKLKELKEKMKDTDFESYFKAQGVETSRIEKYRSGMYPAGIYPSENLQNAVSPLKESGVSDAFEIPKGAMIVKVVKAYPFDEKKFEAEKEDFKKAKAGKLLNDRMNDLLEKLRKDLSLNLERMKAIFPEDAKAS